MHCGRARAPRCSKSQESRYRRRALNYLYKLQDQRHVARATAKRKTTVFAHAAEKTTQRNRQEKRRASLRAPVIARGFMTARKMPLSRACLQLFCCASWAPLLSQGRGGGGGFNLRQLPREGSRARGCSPKTPHPPPLPLPPTVARERQRAHQHRCARAC